MAKPGALVPVSFPEQGALVQNHPLSVGEGQGGHTTRRHPSIHTTISGRHQNGDGRGQEYVPAMGPALVRGHGGVSKQNFRGAARPDQPTDTRNPPLMGVATPRREGANTCQNLEVTRGAIADPEQRQARSSSTVTTPTGGEPRLGREPARPALGAGLSS